MAAPPPDIDVILSHLTRAKAEEDSESIIHVLRQNRQYLNLLFQQHIDVHQCSGLAAVLALALDHCRDSQWILDILVDIKNSVFLRDSIPRVIQKLYSNVDVTGLTKLLPNTVRVVQEIGNRMPQSMATTFGLLDLMKQIITKIQAEVAINEEDVNDFDVIVSDIDELREEEMRRLMEQSEKRKYTRQFAIGPPPEPFTDIPILPRECDIFPAKNVYLRPNKKTGAYENLEEYLDVHFRLYREDSLSGLREGIKEYLQKASRNHDGRHLNLQDARLYRDVQVKGLKLTHQGRGFIIQLNKDQSSRIKWESSKRLLFGSLLCFSSNNFETLIFATVLESDRDKLKDTAQFLAMLDPNGTSEKLWEQLKYLMVETTAYFESYQHVLSALQKSLTNGLPFEQYIVGCSRDIEPPHYLDRQSDTGVTYDLSCLLKSQKQESTQTVEKCSTMFTRHLGINITKGKASTKKYSYVDIMSECEWPPAETMGLDTSQYEALRAGLTKEFVLIQGPPGTGKTYVGLKIAQALLTNLAAWQRSPALDIDEKLFDRTPLFPRPTHKSDPRPLLVVCYTNHALDQFLEGILNCYKPKSRVVNRYEVHADIVRVGGRGNNERVQKYSLKSLRRSHVWDIRQQIEKQELALAVLSHVQSILPHNIVDEETLKPVMPPNHHESLTKGKGPRPRMLKWLCVDIQALQTSIKNSSSKKRSKPATCSEKIEIKFDAAHVEDNRRIEEDVSIKCEIPKDLSIGFDVLLFQEMVIQNLFQMEEKLGTGYTTSVGSILGELSNNSQMSAEEAARVQNVWRLSVQNRWRLYRFWVSLFGRKLTDDIQVTRDKYNKSLEAYRTEQRNADSAVLRGATLIGMTTTGASRYHDILHEIAPKIIIVEEAAEVLESHLIATLNPKCEHLILIGDHKQLKPNPSVYRLATKYNLDLSLFERMINNGLDCRSLQKQHRMRPAISNLLRHIYPHLEDNENVKTYQQVRGVGSSLYFIDHTVPEDYNGNLRSYANSFEAKYIVELCRYLIKQGYKPTEITVLTLYTGQLFCLRNCMPKSDFFGVRVSVVDSFQGEENEIIILSLVRSNTDGKIGFVGIDNRICVSLSRAKLGMYVVGNMAMMENGSELWKKVINDVKTENWFGPSLPLYCVNHPRDERIDAKTPEDFSRAPLGGCMRKCEFRYDCGHVCHNLCHAMDQEHETEYLCRQGCVLRCEGNHLCHQKCHFPDACKPCLHVVEKELPQCGHIEIMKCHVEPGSWECRIRMSLKLVCGHFKEIQCHEQRGHLECRKAVWKELPICGHIIEMECCRDPAGVKCTVEMSKKLPCGHFRHIQCWERDVVFQCDVTVKRQLPCGHSADMSCYRKATAYSCREMVDKVLPGCGHVVNVPCNEHVDRSMCSEMVDKVNPDCGHGQRVLCSSRRFGACKSLVDAPVSCEHAKIIECHSKRAYQCRMVVSVTLPCGHKRKSECRDREKPCTARCNKKLECGHPCTGNCESCTGGRLHVPCFKACHEVLVCGHVCKGKLHGFCPPCSDVCQNYCPHSACDHVCHEPCTITDCRLPCKWNCPHYMCTKMCGEVCDRPRCSNPCPHRLSCGHRCHGYCGEPCPNICSLCDHTIWRQLISKKSRRKNIFLVHLEYCGHTFEASFLDDYVETQTVGITQVGYPKCPQCGMDILRHPRYDSLLRSVQSNIQAVHRKISEVNSKIMCTNDSVSPGASVMFSYNRKAIDSNQNNRNIRLYIDSLATPETELPPEAIPLSKYIRDNSILSRQHVKDVRKELHRLVLRFSVNDNESGSQSSSVEEREKIATFDCTLHSSESTSTKDRGNASLMPDRIPNDLPDIVEAVSSIAKLWYNCKQVTAVALQSDTVAKKDPTGEKEQPSKESKQGSNHSQLGEQKGATSASGKARRRNMGEKRFSRMEGELNDGPRSNKESRDTSRGGVGTRKIDAVDHVERNTNYVTIGTLSLLQNQNNMEDASVVSGNESDLSLSCHSSSFDEDDIDQMVDEDNEEYVRIDGATNTGINPYQFEPYASDADDPHSDSEKNPDQHVNARLNDNS
ncbi:hypothetical protein ScPMuIL_018506, partial [Solemya velum]